MYLPFPTSFRFFATFLASLVNTVSNNPENTAAKITPSLALPNSKPDGKKPFARIKRNELTVQTITNFFRFLRSIVLTPKQKLYIQINARLMKLSNGFFKNDVRDPSVDYCAFSNTIIADRYKSR